MAHGARAVADELEESFRDGLGRAAAALFLRQSAYAQTEAKSGLVCRAFNEEFAGCLLYAPCPSSAKDAVLVTDFFVDQNYRGLGIARELMKLCLSQVKESGVHWIIIANTTVPQSLDSLVTRMGFERKGTVLAADVTKL